MGGSIWAPEIGPRHPAPNRDQRGGPAMSTQPEPDDSYPSSWTPKGLRDREIQPTAVEVWLASLDESEFDALARRVRGYRGGR